MKRVLICFTLAFFLIGCMSNTQSTQKYLSLNFNAHTESSSVNTKEDSPRRYENGLPVSVADFIGQPPEKVVYLLDRDQDKGFFKEERGHILICDYVFGN